MPFKPGQSGNPAGCPKGAHHIGRPASKVKELAKRRSYKILKRMADIADGKALEQVVNENGETIRVPAPVREQTKAGEVVLKVASELGADIEINQVDNSRRMVLIFPQEAKGE